MKPLSLETCLQQSPMFWLDGGTGEELFRRNVPDDRKLWSATAVVHDEYHETLRAVHRSFLEAGSQAITTNTYGIIPAVGFSSAEIQQYCAVAARLARQVVEEQRDAPQAYVLGSLGPLVESYRPDLIRSHDEGVAIYELMVTAMAPHIDAVLAETMSSVEEAMQPIDALAQFNNVHCDQALPLFISFTLQSQGHLRSNEPVEHALERILDFARKKNVRVLAVMFNCCSPEAISIALQRLHDNESARKCLCVFGAYPNRLTEVAPDWTMAESSGPQPFRTDMDPAQYAELVQTWRHKFPLLRIVGGCCGITPEHIAFLKQVVVD